MSIVFVPLANTFRCELIYLQNGQHVENVYHVLSGGGVAVADANRIAAKLAAWWVASQRSVVGNYVSLERIEVIDASQQGGVGIIYTTGLPQAGSVTANPMPGNLTVAVKWSTGFTGKSFRGRSFHVGMNAGAFVGNQITTAFQTALQTVYTALITALAGGGTADTLVVGSKRHNNAWRVTGVTTTITACSVDIDLDSQRRRLTGTGRGT